MVEFQGQQNRLLINSACVFLSLIVICVGGGACWSAETCNRQDNRNFNDVGVLDDFVDPFFGLQLVDCAEWNSIVHAPQFGGLVDREETDNPVAGWSYVFVTYCTKVLVLLMFLSQCHGCIY